MTEFIANHPGGSEKILMGAGGAIERYWYCELRAGFRLAWYECFCVKCMLYAS